MDFLKYILGSIIFLMLIVVIYFGSGMLDAIYIKTVGKEIQDSKREVFESSNSFIKGKKQETIKYYKEWTESDNENDKKAIENFVSMSLADFDEDKYVESEELLQFIRKCKY